MAGSTKPEILRQKTPVRPWLPQTGRGDHGRGQQIKPPTQDTPYPRYLVTTFPKLETKKIIQPEIIQTAHVERIHQRKVVEGLVVSG